jgi:hypothetical protein
VKIYFFCHPQGDKHRPAFQHQLINLAFGLKELGIEYYSNIDYWKLDQENYLFQKSTIAPGNCDVLITSHGEFEYNWPLDKLFSSPNRSYKTIYIDTADGLFTRSYDQEMRAFDIILKQKSKGMWYPDNCSHPWVFGLSPYMSLNNDAEPPIIDRGNEILVNYRHLHTYRTLGEKVISKLNKFKINRDSESLDYSKKCAELNKLTDFHELAYSQSGGRFHHHYLKRLTKSTLCACFGGSILPPTFFLKNKNTLRFSHYFYANTNKGRLVELIRKFNLQIKHRYGIYQWDSWRLWETFATGSLVVNVDFEKYGLELPVMPTNFKHYVGIDLLNPQEGIERINSLSINEIQNIANDGATWAHEHYSPKAVAQRFIELINTE